MVDPSELNFVLVVTDRRSVSVYVPGERRAPSGVRLEFFILSEDRQCFTPESRVSRHQKLNHHPN